MIKSLLAKVRKLFETTTEEVVAVTTQVEQKVEELKVEVAAVVEEVKVEVQPIVEAVVQEVKEVVEVVKTPVQKLSKAKVEKKPRKPKSAKVQK